METKDARRSPAYLLATWCVTRAVLLLLVLVPMIALPFWRASRYRAA